MPSDDDPVRGPDYVRECLDLVKLAATVSSLELREELLKIATVYERLALREFSPAPAAPDEPPQCGKP